MDTNVVTPTNTPTLVDGYGRHVNYVRISVTDRCDFRCVYCMSEDIPSGNIEILKQAIIESMTIKLLGHEFDLTSSHAILRHMNVTGG